MRNHKLNKNGFTLIELLVTITIPVILIILVAFVYFFINTVSKEVDEKGLKGITEEVWNGKKELPEGVEEIEFNEE